MVTLKAYAGRNRGRDCHYLVRSDVPVAIVPIPRDHEDFFSGRDARALAKDYRQLADQIDAMCDDVEGKGAP